MAKRKSQNENRGTAYQAGLDRAAEVEREVLGCVLLAAPTWQQASRLSEQDFSLDSHRRIFMRMRDLAESGRPIDSTTLLVELARHRELELIGGAPYLASLLDGMPVLENISHYLHIVEDYAVRRRGAKAGEALQRLSSDESVSATALAEVANGLATEISDSDPLPPRFSEEALALRFSRRYASELRYVGPWGHWMVWDGKRWVRDNTLHVFDLARRICRATAAECGDAEKATAMRVASKATSAAVERLAAADRRHAAAAEQWDTDQWVLNTPAGTVDLRTGEVREHRRDDYIMKVASAGPGGDCPLWLHFLDRVTGGDRELQSFLQRMVGYALTGSTREHALFFLYGTGANGKTVFLSTISGLLADYAKTAPVASFTASATEQHPTDLAGLRGARLVTAIETEDGARWAEAKIKSLTGGDKIAARFMRCDFFEFTPEFKLVIAGNHKPSLRAVDEAMRRRLHLIPFTITIPKEEREPSLGEKLRAEFPGILAWAVEGCLTWQCNGLNPPAVVREATAAYLDSEDAIGRWLEERTVAGPGHWTAASALFSDWQAWCQQAGERDGSQKHFAQQLEARGFQRHRTSQAKGFTGIGLREDVVPDVPVSHIFPVTHAHADALCRTKRHNRH